MSTSKKNNSRVNCFVTSFPFVGENTNQVNNTLQNEEKLLRKILPNDVEKPYPATENESLMKANPFVFMMNKAKYESMLTKDVDEPTEYMRVNRGID
jgi:hypothetical protein